MKSRYLYSSLLALSFVTSTLAMENKDPKPTSLKVFEKLMGIQKKSKNPPELNGKSDNENLNFFLLNLTSIHNEFTYLDLTEIGKDLVTLQTVKRNLPFLFENASSLEMLCKQLENNLKKSKSSSEANYSLATPFDNRHPSLRPKNIRDYRNN